MKIDTFQDLLVDLRAAFLKNVIAMKRARLLRSSVMTLVICACVLDSPWKQSSGWQPANDDDGWEILSPQSVQIYSGLKKSNRKIA